jgi:hypothetical protein
MSEVGLGRVKKLCRTGQGQARLRCELPFRL